MNSEQQDHVAHKVQRSKSASVHEQVTPCVVCFLHLPDSKVHSTHFSV